MTHPQGALCMPNATSTGIIYLQGHHQTGEHLSHTQSFNPNMYQGDTARTRLLWQVWKKVTKCLTQHVQDTQDKGSANYHVATWTHYTIVLH